MSVEDKKNKQGPRKLLALDGGGIRGVMTLEVLAKIESELQDKLGRDDRFVLADYFDYIAGTSTGAIIATCLSLGMRVADIRSFYIESGPAMFDKTNLIRRYFRNKFHDQKLAAKLQNVIAEKTGEPTATLGSPALRTYLMLVLRNATTDSPWPVSNNPEAKTLRAAPTARRLRSGNCCARACRPPIPSRVITHSVERPWFLFVEAGHLLTILLSAS